MSRITVNINVSSAPHNRVLNDVHERDPRDVIKLLRPGVLWETNAEGMALEGAWLQRRGEV